MYAKNTTNLRIKNAIDKRGAYERRATINDDDEDDEAAAAAMTTRAVISVKMRGKKSLYHPSINTIKLQAKGLNFNAQHLFV